MLLPTEYTLPTNCPVRWTTAQERALSSDFPLPGPSSQSTPSTLDLLKSVYSQFLWLPEVSRLNLFQNVQLEIDAYLCVVSVVSIVDHASDAVSLGYSTRFSLSVSPIATACSFGRTRVAVVDGASMRREIPHKDPTNSAFTQPRRRRDSGRRRQPGRRHEYDVVRVPA